MHAQPENRLLANLPEAEHRRLFALLEPVSLKARQSIYPVRATIDHVYFPLSGIVSAMTVMTDGKAIEVATIGKEGMVGLVTFVGGQTSPYEVMVQVPGHGLRMAVDRFKEEAKREGQFRNTLIGYNSAFAVQVSYAVACNGLHSIEQRCCRWLLMTQDRVGTSLLPLTHEFLAIMLGVRRASITDVLQPLQKRGLVRNDRGEIEIVDRAGIESLACECYSAVEEEFRRTFGS